MTIILECNMCEKEQINFLTNKITHIDELKERGWTHIKNQIHICASCTLKQQKWDMLQEGILDDFESSRIMNRDIVFEEKGNKKPSIDILDGSNKVKIRVRKCRYCELTHDFTEVPDKMRHHEKKEHPNEYIARKRGGGTRGLPKLYRNSTQDD